MNVSLRPELKQFLNRLIETGQYYSAEEALNKALQLLKNHEDTEDKLEACLKEGEESGPATEMAPDDWAEIEKEGLAKVRSRKLA